jgi:hypothetical protein
VEIFFLNSDMPGWKTDNGKSAKIDEEYEGLKVGSPFFGLT